MTKFQIALGAVCIVLIAACQVPSGGTGGLKITVPSPQNRALEGHGNKVRLQLVRNGAVLPLSGNQFIEDSIAGQTITIDGLPTGAGYTLNLSTGTSNADGFFEVGNSGSSDPFEVSAGIDTKVSVKLDKSPVQLFASGAGPHESLVIHEDGNDQLYISKGGKAYNLLQATFASPNAEVPLSGTTWGTRHLSSFGLAYDQAGKAKVTFNTELGVGSWTGSAFDFAMKESDGALIVPDVRFSDAFFYHGDSIFTLNLYAGSGLTAGMAVVNTGHPTPEWKEVETLLDLPKDLKSSLEGSEEGLIRGFNSTEKFAYISTALGVFRVDTIMLSGKDTDGLGKSFSDGADEVKVGARLGDRSLSIGPVSGYYDGVNSGLVFAGTSRGLFSAVTDAIGKPVGAFDSLTLVDGTYGLDIGTVESKRYNGKAYTAAWAKNSGDLLIVTGQGTLVKKVPRLAGLPAGQLSLTWWNLGATLKLVVSGDDGTVLLDVATSAD